MATLYDALLQELVEEWHRSEDVVGILLTGSLARGDALPGTDVDLRLILSEGLAKPPRRELRDGVLVEMGFSDEAAAVAKLETHPMNVYAYLDGRILHDPQGSLDRLSARARRRFETYETSEQDKAGITTRLQYCRDKICVARSGGDLLKAAFVTGTSSWAIMEGLWAANNRPLPPNSSVRPHLRDLPGPPGVDWLYRQLFLAETPQRVQVAVELLDWIIARLAN